MADPVAEAVHSAEADEVLRRKREMHRICEMRRAQRMTDALNNLATTLKVLATVRACPGAM